MVLLRSKIKVSKLHIILFRNEFAFLKVLYYFEFVRKKG